MPKKAVLWIVPSSILLTATTLVILSYTSGLYYFAKAYFKDKSCSTNINQEGCNRLSSVLRNEPLTTVEGVKSHDTFYLNAILLSLSSDTIRVWTPQGLIKTLTINNKTSYGIAVPFTKGGKDEKKLADLINYEFVQTTTVPKIESSETTGINLVAYSQSINFESFSFVIKPGDLVKIIYNNDSLTAADILLIGKNI